VRVIYFADLWELTGVLGAEDLFETSGLAFDEASGGELESEEICAVSTAVEEACDEEAKMADDETSDAREDEGEKLLPFCEQPNGNIKINTASKGRQAALKKRFCIKPSMIIRTL